MPFLTTGLASLLSGGLWGSGFLGGLGLGGAATAASGLGLGGALLRIGASLLINTAVNALQAGRGQTAQDYKRELSAPTTAPAYRFVYGETRATGTPVGTPVRGPLIWGCWILNSRPSYLPDFTLYLDERAVTLTGDAFDFEGSGSDYGGAIASNAPFDNWAHCWIGRGDQTTPPRWFREQAPWAAGADEELWKATDGWQGRTVIWIAFNAGPNETRQERWPNTPPIVEVEGKFSLVWDPRDEEQDGDDPSTWTWSDNHALICLDAVRQHPVRAYQVGSLHLQSFIDGAETCDESVGLNAGGSEARYRAAGTMLFDTGEFEDHVLPLFASGAADIIRIGGKLGYAAGEYRAPTITVTDFLQGGIEETDLAPEDELTNTLRVTYLSPDRGYETADLQPWEIPGALTEDGGIPSVKDLPLSYCPSATQAMRVRKIAGGRLRRQGRLSGVLPPEAFDLVGGATVTIAAGHAAFADLDGVYEIESINPALDPLGQDGEVAMRLPVKLVRHSADIYDWDPATDEEAVVDEPYDGTRSAVQMPGTITATTGAAANLDSGGTITPRILYEFDPSGSSGVEYYEWQMRTTTGGSWGEQSGPIPADVRNGSDEVFVYVPGVAAVAQDFRVRTITPNGKSNFRALENQTAIVSIDLDLPINGTASETDPGTIEVSFTLPNDPDVRGLEIYAGPTSDPEDAAALDDPVYAAQNTVITLEETGLGSGVTRYYFARSRGDFSSASAFTAAVSATTA